MKINKNCPNEIEFQMQQRWLVDRHLHTHTHIYTIIRHHSFFTCWCWVLIRNKIHYLFTIKDKRFHFGWITLVCHSWIIHSTVGCFTCRVFKFILTNIAFSSIHFGHAFSYQLRMWAGIDVHQWNSNDDSAATFPFSIHHCFYNVRRMPERLIEHFERMKVQVDRHVT